MIDKTQAWSPFTPEDVVAAYRAKRLTPAFNTFAAMAAPDGTIKAFRGSCCAATALMVGEPNRHAGSSDVDVVSEFADKFGFTNYQAWSFIRGFDGEDDDPVAKQHDAVRHSELGLACRAAVLKAYEIVISETPL